MEKKDKPKCGTMLKLEGKLLETEALKSLECDLVSVSLVCVKDILL